MDIIVTVPMKYDFNPKLKRTRDANGTAYWHVGRLPKDAEPGEHIYFLQNGSIRWRAKIDDLIYDEIDFRETEDLPQPWVQMKGFRGFRYYREDH